MHDKKGSWRSGEEGLEWLGIRICMSRVRKTVEEGEGEGNGENGEGGQREKRAGETVMKRGRRRKQKMPDEREMAGTKDIVCVP